jgi:hypothetical protein
VGGLAGLRRDVLSETERHRVFLRIDKLQIELPRPQQADQASAGIVQELLGGKFGENRGRRLLDRPRGRFADVRDPRALHRC